MRNIELFLVLVISVISSDCKSLSISDDAESNEAYGSAYNEDDASSRLASGKTIMLPTRTKTVPIWNRASGILPATVESPSPVTARLPDIVLDPTPPANVTDAKLSPEAISDKIEPVIEIDQAPDWLREAIEEMVQVVQREILPTKNELNTAVGVISETERTIPVTLVDGVGFVSVETEKPTTGSTASTTTPRPVSVSSSTLWVTSEATQRPSSISTAEATKAKTTTTRTTRTTSKPIQINQQRDAITRTTLKVSPIHWIVTSQPTKKSTETTRTTSTTTLATSTSLLTTLNNKVIRSTTKLQDDDYDYEVTTAPFVAPTTPSTVQWWESPPNYQFATLIAQEKEASEDKALAVPVEKTTTKRPSELPPPPPNPLFNLQQDVLGSLFSSNNRFPVWPSTPRRPVIVRAPSRSTTTTQAPRTRPTQRPRPSSSPTRRRRPSVVPIRQRPAQHPNSVFSQFIRLPQVLRPPFPVDSGVTDSPLTVEDPEFATETPENSTASFDIELIVQETLRPPFPPNFTLTDSTTSTTAATTSTTASTTTSTTSTTTEQPPSSTSPSNDTVTTYSYVLVNLWSYVNGQLSLVGQQLVPSTVLNGTNAADGAILTTSALSATLLEQLAALLNSATSTTTTSTSTTTTTKKPSRPYGGVGNPSLIGIIQTVDRNNTYYPSPTYGAPKPPSQTYGPPKAPSQTYGVPSLTYGLPKAPSSTYGVPQAPSTTYGAPPAPSSTYGVPPIPSSTYGAPPVPSSTYGAPPVAVRNATKTASAIVPESVIYSPPLPSATMNQFPQDPVKKKAPNRVGSNTNNLHLSSNLLIHGPLHTPPGAPAGSVGMDPGPTTSTTTTSTTSAPFFINANTNNLNRRPTPRPAKPTRRRPILAVKKPNRGPTFVNKKNTNKATSGAIRPSLPSAGPTAFVQGGNPLGALLPDFILEELSQQVHSLPVDAISKAPTGFERRSGLATSSETDAQVVQTTSRTSAVESRKISGLSAEVTRKQFMDSGSTSYSDEQDDEDFDEIDEHVTPPPRHQSIDNLRFGQTDQWDALLPRPPDNLATYLQAAAPGVDRLEVRPPADDGSQEEHDDNDVQEDSVISMPSDDDDEVDDATPSTTSSTTPSTTSRRPFAVRPYQHSALQQTTTRKPVTSVMENYLENGVGHNDKRAGAGLTVVKPALPPSLPAHPSEEENFRQPATTQPPAPPRAPPAPVVATSTARAAPFVATTARPVPSATTRTSFFRRNGISFLPAAAISAAALTLPILIGRRRRQFWDDDGVGGAPLSPPWPWHWLDEPDVAVKHFASEHRREMRRQHISTLGCRQLAYGPDDNQQVLASRLLVCPGRRSKTLHLIFVTDAP